MSTEKHVYEVAGFGYWIAKDAQQARRAALAGVTARRLTGGEALAAFTAGHPIGDAEKTLAKADQPDLPLPEAAAAAE